MNGMEVRKKRPRGFKKEAEGVQVSPLNPPSVAPTFVPLIDAIPAQPSTVVVFARPPDAWMKPSHRP